MTRSNTAGTAKRVPGKPFTKGDPRINRNGQVSKERLAFNKTLRELIVSEGEKEKRVVVDNEDIRIKNVERLVKSVWKKAIEGESWAVNFIAERVDGKITQPMDVTGQIEAVIVSDKFLPKDENGTKPK